MAKWVCFGNLIFLIWLTGFSYVIKRTWHLVDCCDKTLLNSSWETFSSSPKARLETFFKTRLISFLYQQLAPPRWLSGEHVGLMTWWLWVRSPVEATFLSGVFSPLTSAGVCEESSRWLWKEKLCLYWYEKARKHIYVTDSHMTLAVKVALNRNTTNQSQQLTNDRSYDFISVVFFLLP